MLQINYMRNVLKENIDPKGYVTSDDYEEIEEMEVVINGNNIPEKIIPETVIRIYADGAELQHIKNNFVNVPYNIRDNGQTWRGFIAAFIIENW